MPKIEPFEKLTQEYEDWFEKNDILYRSELNAVKREIPDKGIGIEIGVGTGRFAYPLGIKAGIEPSEKMAEIARSRGIEVQSGVAEALPFENNSFDYILMVTTVCFLDEISKAFKEANRVLKPGGRFIIGFIDRESVIGKKYQNQKDNDPFYKWATFYSTEELAELLYKATFTDLRFSQTIFGNISDSAKEEPVKEGYGEGSFVVINAKKQ